MPDRDDSGLPVTSQRLAALLEAIEREPAPERLVELARELQEALRARAAETDRKN